MFKILQNCNLFIGLDYSEIESCLKTITYQVKKYSKGDMLVQSGEELGSIKILIEGSVAGEMTDFTGRTIKIEDIDSPRCLAPAFLFGGLNRYPVDLVANNHVLLISVPKAEFLKMLSLSEVILRNYLDIISNRAQFLSGKLKFLSFQSIKGKLAHMILSLSKESNSDTVKIQKTHSEISEMFGVARPSLTRAIREMDAEGLISTEGKSIVIIDKSGLSALLR